MSTLYDYTVIDSFQQPVTMSDYKGKVLLIVNTASKCGFTPQFEGLEKLYLTYKDQGFEILGFPSNQFAEQDPGTQEEIVSFCKLNYGVTFPIFEKTDVKGPTANPLFQHLTESKKGFLGSKEIKWNFTKFLVDREGNVVKRFAPTDTPESIEKHIKGLL